MTRIWRHITAAGALAIILAVWGCDQGTEPTGQLLQAERPESGLLGGAIDEALDSDLTIEEVEALVPVEDPLGPEELMELNGLKPVQSLAGAAVSQVVSAVFGVDGGQLELEGHLLTVPAGAVLAPTRFTMRQVPNGGVEVDLRATQAVAGNIGSSGFEIPVQLALSYAGTDGESNPEDLVIVRVATGERLETEVVEGSRVQAELDHFSRYRICTN